MKRLIAIFFLTVYANVALCTSLEFHYCGGKLSNVKVLNIGAGCGCHSKSEMPGCCKDVVKYCKTDSHNYQVLPEVTNPEKLIVSPVFLLHKDILQTFTRTEQIIATSFRRMAFRVINDYPLFIIYRVFRI